MRSSFSADFEIGYSITTNKCLDKKSIVKGCRISCYSISIIFNKKEDNCALHCKICQQKNILSLWSDWNENWCCSKYGPCDYDSRLEPSFQYSCSCSSCSSFPIVDKRKKRKKKEKKIIYIYISGLVPKCPCSPPPKKLAKSLQTAELIVKCHTIL